MSSRAILAALALLAACRSDDTDGPPPDAAPDAAPAQIGCTATTPRTVPVTAFVAPSGYEARVIAAIDGAQHTLDLHMYLFTVQDIATRIVAAGQRGVAVRVILDPDEAGNTSVRGKLTSAGVANRNAASVYQYAHAKYFIIDGATAHIMSANFNATAVGNPPSGERNYGVVDADPEDVADLAAIFEMDWALAGGEPPKPADLSCTRLVVSPVNSRQRVLDLVNSAQTTLELEVLYLADTTIRAAVLQATDRGVAVRAILSAPEADDTGTSSVAATTTTLKARGIPVKWGGPDDGGFYLHAKLIMADGHALVASENLSQTSLDQNREVGVIVTEPDQFAVIHAQFEADWTAATTQ